MLCSLHARTDKIGKQTVSCGTLCEGEGRKEGRKQAQLQSTTRTIY
jgi:hypothetical protein